MNSTIRINLYIRKDAAPELFVALEQVSSRKRGEVIRRLAMQALCTQGNVSRQGSVPVAS